MINVSVSVKTLKNVMRESRIVFRILLHIVVKMLNMKELLLMIQ